MRDGFVRPGNKKCRDILQYLVRQPDNVLETIYSFNDNIKGLNMLYYEANGFH